MPSLQTDVIRMQAQDTSLAGIRARRLGGQLLVGNPLSRPEDVVRHLGAVQAQDYSGARWALGMRLQGLSDQELQAAFDAGRLLRTHILRPTWHFVDPADIRWMLAVSGPRVHAANAHYYRKLELGEAEFRLGRRLIEQGLAGTCLTRDEIGDLVAAGGISACRGHRLAYLVMYLELEGVLISGPRRGKQFTYALLEERVPPATGPDGDDALAALSLQFFRSRGPATLKDFGWWSGLTLTQARRAIDAAGPDLIGIDIAGQRHWHSAAGIASAKGPECLLLPNYDEYFIGYKDRSAYAERLGPFTLDPNQGGIAPHVVFMQGEIVGAWRKRQIQRESVLEVALRVPVTQAERNALGQAAARYEAFLQEPVRLEVGA